MSTLDEQRFSWKDIVLDDLNEITTDELDILSKEIVHPEDDAAALDKYISWNMPNENFYITLKEIFQRSGWLYTDKVLLALVSEENFRKFLNTWSHSNKTLCCYKITEILGVNETMYTILVSNQTKEQKLSSIDLYLDAYRKSGANIHGRSFLLKHTVDIESDSVEPVLKEKINSIVWTLWFDYFRWFPSTQLEFAKVINKNFIFWWVNPYSTNYYDENTYDVLFGNVFYSKWDDKWVRLHAETSFRKLYTDKTLSLTYENILKNTYSVETLCLILTFLTPTSTLTQKQDIVVHQFNKKQSDNEYKALLLLHLWNASLDIPYEVVELIYTRTQIDFLLEWMQENETYIKNNIDIAKKILQNRSKNEITKLNALFPWLALNVPQNYILKSVEEYNALDIDQKKIYLATLPHRTVTQWNEFSENIFRINEYILHETNQEIRNLLFADFQEKYLDCMPRTLSFFDHHIASNIMIYLDHKDYLYYVFKHQPLAKNYSETKSALTNIMKETIKTDMDYQLIYYAVEYFLEEGVNEIDISSLNSLSKFETLNHKTSLLLNNKRFIVQFNALAHKTDFKILPIYIEDITLFLDVDMRWVDLLHIIWSKDNYYKNKEAIKNFFRNPSQDILCTLLRFDKDDIDYNEALLSVIGSDFTSNLPPFWKKQDRIFLDTWKQYALEKVLLQDASSQQEKRDNMDKKWRLLFLQYCNIFWILVDPRIFMKFDATQVNKIETDNEVILKFLEWVDVDHLERYTKFGIESLQQIINMLVYYMKDNNDAIRRIAIKKATQAPSYYKPPSLFDDSLHIEDYWGKNTLNKVAWAQNAHTTNKIEHIDKQKFSEGATLDEAKQYQLTQVAIEHMSTKLVVKHKMKEIPSWKEGVNYDQSIEDKSEMYRVFVEKLQKYATATFYQFLEVNSPEPGMSQQTKDAIKEYLASGVFIWSTIYPQQSDWMNAGFSSNTLGVAKNDKWKVSIHLNLYGIIASAKSDASNEDKSDLDALADVFLHEYIHVIDHAIQWSKELAFDETEFRWVELEEVKTEMFATYLELFGNEKEMTETMKKWLNKWMNTISFIQFLNEWYESWSDDVNLIEFFEFSKSAGMLWKVMELYVIWDLEWLRVLIDDIYKDKTPQKTWKDIIPIK